MITSSSTLCRLKQCSALLSFLEKYVIGYKPSPLSCISVPPDSNALASISRIKSRSNQGSYKIGTLVTCAFNSWKADYCFSSQTNVAFFASSSVNRATI